MSLLDILRNFFSVNRSEGAVAQYVIREHHRGRGLEEILGDPYVTNRCTPRQVDRLLDRPEVVHAIGEDMIARVRS